MQLLIRVTCSSKLRIVNGRVMKGEWAFYWSMTLTTALWTHNGHHNIRQATSIQFDLLEKMIKARGVKPTISINKLSRATTSSLNWERNRKQTPMFVRHREISWTRKMNAYPTSYNELCDSFSFVDVWFYLISNWTGSYSFVTLAIESDIFSQSRSGCQHTDEVVRERSPWLDLWLQ